MDFFDEDDLLEDYINDDDQMFSQHENHFAGGGGFDDDDDAIEARMMEEAEAMIMEEESRKNNGEQQVGDVEGVSSTVPNTATTTTTTASAPGNDDIEDAETNRRVVNEYLESRRSVNDGYSLDRFNLDVDNWREVPKSSVASNRKKTNNNITSSRISNRNSSNKERRGGGSHHHTTPVAQFLDLLQFRACRETTSSAHWTGTTRSKVPQSLDNNEDDHDGDDVNSIQRIGLMAKSSNGVMRTPKQGVQSLPMTIGDGTRVHIFNSTPEGNNKTKHITFSSKSSPSSFSSPTSTATLGVSMNELKRRVEAIQRHKIAQRNKWAETSNSRTSTRNDRLRSSSKHGHKVSTKNYGDQLWVDRHAPASFGHLLSDERTNRAVLRALREWDPYVFGREPPASSWNTIKAQNQNQGGSNRSGTGGNLNPKNKRPEESRRVILISGPPGVGKSTLAHIVARHAGYQAVEVNASDDRSSNVLVDRVVRAMESTTINFSSAEKTNQMSTTGKENDNTSSSEQHKGNTSTVGKSRNDNAGRPNCIILDEIDGADAKGAIQALVDMIRADIPSKHSKQKVPYLRRPIICICNHKHSPVLRPLQKYVLHFNVDAPSSARLVVRLKDILNREGLNMAAGGSLLQKLNDSTGGDIRSCINTLQFASSHSKSSNDLTLALTDVLNGSGLKDSRCDLPSTLMTVFQKAKARTILPGRHANTIGKAGGDKHNTMSVIESIEGFGDDATATSAIFMNIMGVSYIDPAFDRCSAAHELLSAIDTSQGGMADNQRSYNQLAPVAAGIHLLCRVEVKPTLNFSTRELADAHFQREANLQLVRQFADALPAKARHIKSRSLLFEEFIPLALWILSAGHGAASLSRAVSSIDILTNMERERFDAHVRILCSLGLTYVQDDSRQLPSSGAKPSYLGGDGSMFGMRLDPPIHHLVEYKTRPIGYMRRREIPSGMKELIAHQVRLASFRGRDENGNPMQTVDSCETPESMIDEKSHSQQPKLTPGVAQAGSPTPKTSKAEPMKPMVTPAKELKAADSAKPLNKTTPSPTAGNFLGIGAKKAKEMKSARRAAAVGLVAGGSRSSKKVKLAHTGSGFSLDQVVKMKYVKGFTQAVRTRCRLEDLE